MRGADGDGGTRAWLHETPMSKEWHVVQPGQTCSLVWLSRDSTQPLAYEVSGDGGDGACAAGDTAWLGLFEARPEVEVRMSSPVRSCALPEYTFLNGFVFATAHGVQAGRSRY